MHRLRATCVDNCTDYFQIGINGTCYKNCPEGYSHFFDIREKPDMYDCYKCNGTCPRICLGAIVKSIYDAGRLRHCMIIQGDIILELENEYSDRMDDLSGYFADIEQIFGSLRIKRYLNSIVVVFVFIVYLFFFQSKWYFNSFAIQESHEY